MVDQIHFALLDLDVAKLYILIFMAKIAFIKMDCYIHIIIINGGLMINLIAFLKRHFKLI